MSLDQCEDLLHDRAAARVQDAMRPQQHVKFARRVSCNVALEKIVVPVVFSRPTVLTAHVSSSLLAPPGVAARRGFCCVTTRTAEPSARWPAASPAVAARPRPLAVGVPPPSRPGAAALDARAPGGPGTRALRALDAHGLRVRGLRCSRCTFRVGSGDGRSARAPRY